MVWEACAHLARGVKAKADRNGVVLQVAIDRLWHANDRAAQTCSSIQVMPQGSFLQQEGVSVLNQAQRLSTPASLQQ